MKLSSCASEIKNEWDYSRGVQRLVSLLLIGR